MLPRFRVIPVSKEESEVMSYILDALKKAERERGIAQVPTLATVHDLREMPRIRPWVVSGIFMLCIAAVLWFLLPALRKSVVPIPTRTKEINHIANQPSVAQIQETTAVDAVPPSLQASRPPAPPGEAGAKAPTAIAVRNAVVSERRLSSSTQAATVPRRSAAGQAPLQPISGAGRSNLEERRPVPGTTQPKPLKEAMADMTMSILMFSDAKAERLVFINGRKYVEGDHVEGDYLLESITPEGAVLSYGGERAILRPGPK